MARVRDLWFTTVKGPDGKEKSETKRVKEEARKYARKMEDSDPALTLRIYAHMPPSSHDRVREAIDRQFRHPEVAETELRQN